MQSLARKPRLKGVESAEPERQAQQAAVAIIPRLTGSAAAAGRWQEHSRWGLSLGVVLLAYAAPLAWWAWPQESSHLNLPPPAAMVVELAPTPVAPPVEQAPQEPLTPPSEPEPEPAPEPEVEVPPLPVVEKAAAELKPAVAEPPKKPRPKKQEPPRKREPEPEPAKAEQPQVESAVQRAAVLDTAQPQSQAAAPRQGMAAPVTDASQLAKWQHSLMTKLHHAKRYPRHSRRLRQEGVVYLRFTVDRRGSVLAASIERSAGHPLLDQETLELIQRAQPLPQFPADIPQDKLEIVVPVEFFLNR